MASGGGSQSRRLVSGVDSEKEFSRQLNCSVDMNVLCCVRVPGSDGGHHHRIRSMAVFLSSDPRSSVAQSKP